MGSVMKLRCNNDIEIRCGDALRAAATPNRREYSRFRTNLGLALGRKER